MNNVNRPSHMLYGVPYETVQFSNGNARIVVNGHSYVLHRGMWKSEMDPFRYYFPPRVGRQEIMSVQKDISKQKKEVKKIKGPLATILEQIAKL